MSEQKAFLRAVTDILMKVTPPAEPGSGSAWYVHIPKASESALVAQAARATGWEYVPATGPRPVARSIKIGYGEMAAVIAEDIALRLGDMGATAVPLCHEPSDD